MSKDLPLELPVFPLSNFIIFPETTVPLNIFEPRYLQMVDDSMKTHRMIGMIQPNKEDQLKPYYPIGCAGRISSFSEQEDGRVLITLSGCIRFQATNILEVISGYLTAEIDWKNYKNDLSIDESLIDRKKLSTTLKRYFDAKGFQVDWSQLESCSDERLVCTLCMICPFDIAEKQALLEVKNLSVRADLLITILEMSCHNDDHTENAKH